MQPVLFLESGHMIAAVLEYPSCAEVLERLKIWASGREVELSLGNRACLALALDLNATAVTCDRGWKEAKVEGSKCRIVR